MWILKPTCCSINVELKYIKRCWEMLIMLLLQGPWIQAFLHLWMSLHKWIRCGSFGGRTHFASTMSEWYCVLITYRVIDAFRGRNNRISSISLIIAWIEIQVWWLIECALKIWCILKTFKTNCVLNKTVVHVQCSAHQTDWAELLFSHTACFPESVGLAMCSQSLQVRM